MAAAVARACRRVCDCSGTSMERATVRLARRAAKARFDEDEAFKTRAREAVTALQSGEGCTQRLADPGCSTCSSCHPVRGLMGLWQAAAPASHSLGRE